MSRLLGSFFGIGYLPGPAGTWASAVTATLLMLAWQAGCPWWGVAVGALVAAGLGIAAGSRAVEDFGSKDPKSFVLDEVAGMLLAGLAAWTPWSRHAWLTLPVAFLWFRATDILKPPPARQLERLPRGWGIVMDDVAAGLQALALTLATLLVAEPLL